LRLGWHFVWERRVHGRAYSEPVEVAHLEPDGVTNDVTNDVVTYNVTDYIVTYSFSECHAIRHTQCDPVAHTDSEPKRHAIGHAIAPPNSKPKHHAI
jgi:hypothetical protein